MSETIGTPIGWERALMAAEKVKERLRRATRAFDDARVPYAVVGGNAVAEWVGRVDEDAVRTTRDVDLLVRRGDLAAVRAALEAAGFVYHQLLDVDRFLDGPKASPAAASTCSTPVRRCGRSTSTRHRTFRIRSALPSFRSQSWMRWCA